MSSSKLMSRSKFLVLAAMLSCAFGAPAYSADTLITEQEAQLPSAAGAIAVSSRGITRGPKIVLVSPSDSGAQKSPLSFKVKFEAYGGSNIDKDAVKVTYMKNPLVDLTKRIEGHVNETGIDFASAVIPPGDHQIRVDVKDTDGRTGTTSFTLKVAK
jgi:hypothetical protein